MNQKLSDLYDRHAAASFDKQLSIGDLVQGQDWRFDMVSGRLSFGEQFSWQVQLLGTESEAAGTWLWAWANRKSDIPPPLLHSAQFVKAMGELLGLTELTNPEFTLDDVDGGYLAILSSGVCQANGYYRAPYQGGALFLLILAGQVPCRIEQPLKRMLTVFPQALQHLPISNHKTAWTGYLRFYGLQGVETGAEILVEQADEGNLRAYFDVSNRLVRLEGTFASTLAPGTGMATVSTMSPALLRQPLVAFGPEMPGWGSWDWVGADMQRALSSHYRTVSFRGQEIPDCDVLVVVKHPLARDVVERAARQAAVLYCPIDAYGSRAEIEADGPMLSHCARILIHCERLRRYFSPYAPVEYMDHHIKFAVPPGRQSPIDGPVLWVGVRTNLPALVEWVNAHPLPFELQVLTNPDTPGQMPSVTDFGFRPGLSVSLAEWSPESHLEWVARSQAALDIKGTDFRSQHKPPAKAIDFIAAGLPVAMNQDSSSVEHLARLGFEVADPLDTDHWLSQEYWEETDRFGAALTELLSVERIGRRFKRIIDEVLAQRRG